MSRKMKTEPAGVYHEYCRGIDYKTALDLYNIVERNNNFYNDKQWEGVNAPDLDKPVLNFLKPVVNYYIAMLISDNIAVNYEPMSGAAEDTDTVRKVIAAEVENIGEQANIDFLNRKMIRNCAVDGDGCYYVWFDAESGRIRVDLVDNTNVYFGNPSDAEVQEQPYIIIAYRKLTCDAAEEAESYGESAENIVPDSDSLYMNSDKDNENNYTTVLLKMWKQDGTVHITKCTQQAVIKKPTDTGLTLYPVAWMNWESVKNSYHGQAPLTGKIQNQIFVNKVFAMVMMFVTRMTIPKIVYDKAKLPEGWNNKIGVAIAANGDPREAIFSSFQPPDISASVINMADLTIQKTKDLMGASDAALGNVKPDNTSAIVAVQKAAGMPLDMQRMDFYNFVESYVRIFIDAMSQYYGVRGVETEGDDGEKILVQFDFSTLAGANYKLKIDIGQGSYWSELMQLQTLDNLMAQNIIPDPVSYLEAIPDGYVKNKEKLIAKLKELQGAGAGLAAATAQEMTGAPQQEAPPQAIQAQPTLDAATIDEIVRELLTLEPEAATAAIEELPYTEEERAAIGDAYAEALKGGAR